MKFNKWTLGLAALGAVSLTSAARADEAKITPLQTALSSTTISGYVDVAAQYNTGNQNAGSFVPAGTAQSKVDNFSLNTLDISLDKPEDASPWASGYHVDLNFGGDAINQVSSNVGIRQAYVVLRTPVGNGIDWKFGVQDDVIGYEGNTDSANPNYTRSVGYYMEPTTLTGIIGAYQVNSEITIQGGLANQTFWGFNGYDSALSDKTFAGSIALTAPDSWGFLKGGTLNVGTLLNLEKGGQNNFYAGVTVPTWCSCTKLGASFDLVSAANSNPNEDTFGNNPHNDSGWDVALYGSYQATDKLSFALRGEYYDLTGATTPGSETDGPTYYGLTNGRGEEVTATVSYALWANVTSRAEFRWDHADTGTAFGPETETGLQYANSFLFAVNVIYTF